MKRALLVISLLPLLASLLFAQVQQVASVRPSVDQLQMLIQAELASHGDRVMGKEAIHWTTRVESFSGCRAEFAVRISSTWGENTVRTETVKLSLGALEPESIEIQKNWLDLPCAALEKCVVSTSTCSQKSKNGMITDCGTASQKRVATFSLQLDGDAAASARLQNAFRDIARLCREPKPVIF